MKASRVLGYVALGTHILYCVLIAFALLYSFIEPNQPHGITRSFAFWIYSMILAGGCIIIHIVDSAFAINKIGAIAVIKLIYTIVEIPVYFLIGRFSRTSSFIIWNATFVVLFCIHAVSLFFRRSSHKAAKPEPLNNR